MVGSFLGADDDSFLFAVAPKFGFSPDFNDLLTGG
jgi:hypothetical protein